MIIEWLNPDYTVARVTRRRRWWSRERVAAILYRHGSCCRDRDGRTPLDIGWLFYQESDPHKYRDDWWSGSSRLERARHRAVRREQDVSLRTLRTLRNSREAERRAERRAASRRLDERWEPLLPLPEARSRR